MTEIVEPGGNHKTRCRCTKCKCMVLATRTFVCIDCMDDNHRGKLVPKRCQKCGTRGEYIVVKSMGRFFYCDECGYSYLAEGRIGVIPRSTQPYIPERVVRVGML